MSRSVIDFKRTTNTAVGVSFVVIVVMHRRFVHYRKPALRPSYDYRSLPDICVTYEYQAHVMADVRIDEWLW